MKKILNLTQHSSTVEQQNLGVTEPTPEVKQNIQNLITFTAIPTADEMKERAKKLVRIVQEADCNFAMVGGANYFMPFLVTALKDVSVTPLFAFTQRVSQDEQQDDGTIKKVVLFKFEGFVEL